MASKSIKVIASVVIVTILLMVPAMLVSLVGWKSAGGIAFIGSFAGVLAAIGIRLKHLVWLSVATGATVFAAVLAAHTPIAAALVMAATGVLLGLSDRWGISRWIMMLPLAPGYALAQPPQVMHVPVLDALVVAGVGFGSVLFSGGMIALALQKHEKPKMPTYTKNHITVFTVNMAVLLGIAGFLVVNFTMQHAGTWLILTVIVIIQPYIDKAALRGIGRAVGTLLGFLLAIGVAYSVHQVWVYIAIGVAFLSIATVFSLTSKPYWLYAMFLTPAVVMLSSGGEDVTKYANFRLEATFEGAVLCLIVIALEWLIFRKGQLSEPVAAAPKKK